MPHRSQMPYLPFSIERSAALTRPCLHFKLSDERHVLLALDQVGIALFGIHIHFDLQRLAQTFKLAGDALLLVDQFVPLAER